MAQYLEDPFTDFTYTNNAYNEVLELIREVSLNQNIKKIPNYVSILILSGAKDPFGDFGIGPKWLYDNLKGSRTKRYNFKTL